MISNISFWLVDVISVSRSFSVSRETGPASETESVDAQDASAACSSSHFFPTTRGATKAKISLDSPQFSRK